MLLDWCRDLLGEFYEGFVLRRPEADAERMGRPPLIGNVPSFAYENGWLNCDFQHGDTTISPQQEAALGAFVAISNHPDVMLKMMLEPGDFQFINNRTILHGRADFEDHAAKDQRRHLYRLWINVPEWPRMPASQSTLVAADMARWDALAAQHRAATPAWAS